MAHDPSGAAQEHQFELSGGRPCLDFVNTISGDRAAEVRERLEAYADVVAWARQAGLVDAERARRLLAEARRRPADAAAVRSEAVELREALYRVFTAVAERREAPRDDVERISAFVGRALRHRRLERSESGFALAWADAPDALDAPLWRVAASAVELLTSPTELERVRVCGLHDSHECSWVFMDTTRARTRRWCCMTSCGNKAKARRHYARVKGA